MPELTARAREQGKDSDQDSLGSLEQSQWRGIQARVEALKIDDDTKPPPTEAVEAASIGLAAADLSALTVPKLKEKLRAKGLLVGGRKQELIDRLLTAQAPAESASIKSASPPPAYLKFKINNGKKEELHFLCLQDEEADEYGDGSAWDWPEKHLQLDYSDVDLEPDIEEITKEEYEKNATAAYSYCFIRDLTPEERENSDEDDGDEDDDDGACESNDYKSNNYKSNDYKSNSFESISF